jgi:hypothetical protein
VTGWDLVKRDLESLVSFNYIIFWWAFLFLEELGFVFHSLLYFALGSVLLRFCPRLYFLVYFVRLTLEIRPQNCC